MNRHEFFRLAGIGIGVILLTACAGPSNPDTPSPNAARKIDFSISLNDKGNENLKTKGGYVIVNDVIVAQTKDGKYIAVSAKCTHDGTQLVYKPVENQFYCPLDLSRFDATGKVVASPAKQALQQYLIVTEPVAGVLRVYN